MDWTRPLSVGMIGGSSNELLEGCDVNRSDSGAIVLAPMAVVGMGSERHASYELLGLMDNHR